MQPGEGHWSGEANMARGGESTGAHTKRGRHVLPVLLQVCSRFTAAPREMGPAAFGPQWCLAQDTDRAVGVPSLILGLPEACSPEAFEPLPNLTWNLILPLSLTAG